MTRPASRDDVAQETLVAARFDALHDRFPSDVSERDPRVAAVLENLGPLEGRRVLDLGCGKGRFGRVLASRGARVVGLDLSSAMLAEAARLGLACVLGSARRLPFRASSFDAAIAVEVLEHLEPRAVAEALGELRRVLSPGGRLVLVDKNVAALNARRPWLPAVAIKRLDEYRGLWMYPAGSPVRERWFRPRGLARRLARWFEDVHVTYLLSRHEAGRFPFCTFPRTRLFVLWAARSPGGAA